MSAPTQDWKGISPRHMVDEFLTVGLFVGLLMAGAISILVIPDVLDPALAWVVVTLASVLSVLSLVLVPFRVRSYRYVTRQDDFVFARGVVVQRLVAVPYGRLQLVDINRGPLARALGLAELKLVTAAASSGVSIPGLLVADAEMLRDQLVELAESRRAGL
ncbi:MAG: Uncharacterised protein [Cellulomonadaceae bacterium TMED98]|nr:MAG: Uncharacterised protein [Cellulomonadaceae bacterium TMED98]